MRALQFLSGDVSHRPVRAAHWWCSSSRKCAGRECWLWAAGHRCRRM